MNFKPQPTHSRSSPQESNSNKTNRAYPLKPCDVCGKTAELLGGVTVKGRWHCARCWVKLLQTK